MKRQGAKIAEAAKMIKSEPSDKLDRLTYDVIGASIEVHQELGPGFLESVYEEALCMELEQRQIPFQRQPIVEVHYKGKAAGEARLDIWVDKALIVELKAVESIAPIHSAQLLSYLKTTHCQLGLLFNFNVRVLKEGICRIINSADTA